ncbi:MAG: PD-(D/E)XK nuclease domain-containing protein [Paludibacteraceae bacterium]|nr:PD-(D/E)XK nuclease domain-containing protein [Paludibacteraceae bacterium]
MYFSQKSIDIYNPFSLLNALKAKSLSNYWFATGTPTYLAKILSKSDINIPDFENELMATEEMIAAFGNGETNTIAAFYQSGYLTIKDYRDGCYALGFPNEEVSEGLTRMLVPNYVASVTSDKKDLDLVKLRQLVMKDDVDAFMTQIQLIMSQIPFESNEVKLIEANFRNMLYLMIRSTGHKVSVEHPVLGGRIDVFFETNKYAYIIECKRDESAETALSQIDEKRYAKKISAPEKAVVKIGANFSTKERNLTEWMVK